jgi:putative heme iron utilization protein
VQQIVAVFSAAARRGTIVPVASSFDYTAELNRGTLAGPDMSDAELARELVEQSRLATLSTFALRPEGFPYGSLVAHAADDRGRPLFLLSALAEHTKNLAACDRASLLVVDPTATSIVTAPRVTIVGHCHLVGESEHDAVRERYVASHPEAATWFADHLHGYALYRLEPIELRVIVGFGRLSWVVPREYAHARDKS